jgi:hypothetical protein
MTGTFKLVKGQLAREGFSSAAAPDPVWFFDRARDAYIPCDDALRARIENPLSSPFSARGRGPG